MSPIKCPKCKAEVSGAVSVCPGCGAPIFSAPPPANRWSHIPRAAWVLGIGFGLLLSAIIYFVLYDPTHWVRDHFPDFYAQRKVNLKVLIVVGTVLVFALNYRASAKNRNK